MNQKLTHLKNFINIINILSLTLLCYLSLTGIRLILFDSRLALPVWLEWLSIFDFGLNIQVVHFSAGLLFTRFLIFKIVFEFFFVRAKPTDEPDKSIYQNRLSSIALALKLLLFTSIISGLLTYSGKISSGLLSSTLVNIHSYSFWSLAAVSIIYVSFRLLSSQRREKDKPKTIVVIPSTKAWIAFVAVMIILMAGLMGIHQLLNREVALSSRRMNRNIVLDGHAQTREWYGIDSVIVPLTGGDNFDNGSSSILVKSFRNRQHIFFLFQWRDNNRSYNRQLLKTDSGWIEIKSDSSITSTFGESVYFEDQLAVSFHRSSSGCLESCHLGNSKQAGSHYTKGDTADVWIWRALSTNPAGEADDGWWAAAGDSGGGIRFDNSAGGGYASNLNREWAEPYFLSYHPAFRYWIDMRSKYFMPYRAGLDIFESGAFQPAVVTAPFMGDRGDIRVRGKWARGLWTVELSRSLNTGSPFDIVLMGTVWMSLAPFDNSEKMHSYHFKTIKLIIEK